MSSSDDLDLTQKWQIENAKMQRVNILILSTRKKGSKNV